MGCDIHVHVERKIDGVWTYCPNELAPVDGFYTDFICKKPESERQPNDEYWNRRTWDPGRNYMLFGILAGVRNRDVTPLSDRRGVPEDSCREIKEAEEDGDGHSHSYLTAAELLKAKESTCLMTGFFDTKGYIQYKETGQPDQWFSKYQLFGREVISNEEMDRRVENIAFSGSEKYITEVIWEFPYKESAPHFWNTIVPALADLDPDPENVRMVFWFDN